MRMILAAILTLVVSPATFAAAPDREPAAPPPPFRAGAATSNVTPPLGTSLAGHMTDRRATHVHDELHARCLVLDDGATKLAIAVVDSCMIPKNVVEFAKAAVAERTGIPPSNVLISATHTHEAATATPVFQSEPDPAYTKFLATRIADGIQRAANNLEPAQIGWTSTQAPEHVFNRRWRLKEGVTFPNPFGDAEVVKMNPPPGSPDLVEPAGPTDPEAFIVAARSTSGRPIALLANYSLHYVGGEGPGAVSADYFGMFAERITTLLSAEHQDPPFVGMMSNGTSGDVNNVNFREPRVPRKPYEQMRAVAEDLATKVAKAAQGIEYRDVVALGARTSTLKLGVRKPTADEMKRAESILARSKHPVQTSLDGIYARETLDMPKFTAAVPVTLQALRVGDLTIGAIPCEVFAEIGLELKKSAKPAPYFTIELANGYNGYLPTPEQHKLGGYETWRAKSSYLEVDASTKIVAELHNLVRDLR
jgi:hypothetical protein